MPAGHQAICVYSVADYGAISTLAITCVRATHRCAKALQRHVAVRVGDQQTIAQAVRQTVEDASARTARSTMSANGASVTRHPGRQRLQAASLHHQVVLLFCAADSAVGTNASAWPCGDCTVQPAPAGLGWKVTVSPTRKPAVGSSWRAGQRSSAVFSAVAGSCNCTWQPPSVFFPPISPASAAMARPRSCAMRRSRLPSLRWHYGPAPTTRSTARRSPGSPTSPRHRHG